MSKRLSFSIAVNLLTENFKKGANTVKNSLRSIQMQVVTFAAALGFGGLGLSGLVSRFKDVARETSRVITALKNVSDGTKGFVDNLRFVNDMANKYGLEVNALTSNFAKFTSSATQANMPMEKQQKVFESLSRASTAFGLSAEDTNGVFLALSQMMGKGKISSEELRKQMGERLPIAMQAMAKAAGVSMNELEQLLKQGKLMSSDIIPKFADALSEMIPNVDTDNLETSLNRLSNTFGDIVNASGAQAKYKALIDGLNSLLHAASKNIQNIIVGIVAAIAFVVSNSFTKVYRGYAATGKQIVANATITHNQLRTAIAARAEAEKAYNNAVLRHDQAIGKQKIAIAREVERAKQLLSARTAQVNAAHEKAKAAAAQAAAIKSRGAWATTYASIVGSAKRVMASLKSMWNTFAPAIIISAVIAVIEYFKNLYNETKRVKNIFADYKKEAESASSTQEVKALEAQLRIMNDKTRSQKEINAAQSELRKMLGDEKLTQEQINKEVAKRIELLKETAKANFYAQKAVVTEDANKTLKRDFLSDYRRSDYSGNTTIEEMIKELEDSNYFNKDGLPSGFMTKHGLQGHSQLIIKNKLREYKENLEVIKDAERYLEDAESKSNILNNSTLPLGDEDKNAENLRKKRLDAEQWLLAKQMELKNESERSQLEYAQKQLDLEEDSFDKRFKQIQLNHKKELLEIKQFETDKLKEQVEAAKKIYISENNGSEKGFDFSKFDKSKLPVGLRSEDIQTELISRDIQATQQQEKDTSDLLRSMLDKYKDYNEQRREINNQYNADELALNSIRNTENAKAIDAALAELKKSREKAIKDINDTEAKEFMKSTDLFVELFEDASRKSISELKGIIGKANELKKVLKDSSADIPEWFVDSQIKDKESLSPEQLEQARAAIRTYIEELKKDPKAIKDFEDAIASLFSTMGNVSPVKKFGDNLSKAIEDIKKGGIENIGAGIEGIGNATQEIMPHLQKFGNDMRSIFGDSTGDSIDGLLKSIESLSEIGTGVGKLMQGDFSGILDVASGLGKIFSHSKQVNKEHREALRLLRLQVEEQKHLYKLEKLREVLSGDTSSTIYGNDDWGKAANATKVYHDAVKELDESLRNLEDVDVVTGSRKSGWGFWKKRKDVWSDLLSTYPQLIDKQGKFDSTLASTILTTQKLSDEGKMAIQQAIDNAEVVEEAFASLKDYLSGLFSDLGQNIMSAFTDAFKGSKSAIADFVDSASDMLGQLVEDFIYNMRLAPIIERASKEAENTMLNNKLTEEQKNQKLIDITGSLIDDILKQQDYVNADLERWGNLIQQETGKNPFVEKKTQNSTRGYSTSMDQDTGGAILGRVTGLHETGIETKALVSAINIGIQGISASRISVNNELVQQKEILDEIRQVQRKSALDMREMKETLIVMKDTTIDTYEAAKGVQRNTKGLIG